MQSRATRVREMPAVRALVLSCHPVPSLAVTLLGAGLTALARLPLERSALVVAMILSGQLAIGWSNDYLDAERDRASARDDKPVALGAVSAQVTGVAAVVASVVGLALAGVLVVVAAPLSGTAGALVLACGIAYNLGLKATAFSWVPYALAFGSLPAAATLAASPPRGPGWWAVAAGAMLGVGAHLANVLPDLAEDAAAGVRGWPHRLGARASALSAVVLLAGASVLVTVGPHAPITAGRWLLLGVVAVAAMIAGRDGYRDPRARRFFLATIVIAVADLVAFAMTGTRL